MHKLKLFRPHPGNLYDITFANHLGDFSPDEKKLVEYVRDILWHKFLRSGLDTWNVIEWEMQHA